jgi:hypothetical protein
VRRRRRTGPLAGAVVLALVAAWAPEALAHKFHASLVEADLNRAAGKLEVGMRLFADDLEAALGRAHGRRVRLDAPNAGALVLEYLGERFVVRDAAGARLELAWVGMEARVDEVWVYVEAPAPETLAGARVEDRVFFELFSDQVNTVNLQEGDARTTLVFTRGDGEKLVSFKEKEPRLVP